ncbi:hypothetical protein ACN38_g6219 [Penicillium nordicum]|uniref:Uncharacterized protein n=1 Tax=Penicillium nordicum TaxID=229535 RepID=A0A0M8P0B5_9EURO|nr:hypothetical protein ACN38_g6219 [Penicillium nordicum]
METSLKHICCSVLFISIRGRQKPPIQSNKEESSPLVVFLDFFEELRVVYDRMAYLLPDLNPIKENIRGIR